MSERGTDEAHEQVLTTTHVVEDLMPVLRVTRDSDGGLQLHDGVHVPTVAAGRLVCLHHLVDRDAGLLDVVRGLAPGTTAVRSDVDAPWSLGPVEPPEPWRLEEALPDLASQLGRLEVHEAARFARAVAERCVEVADWSRLDELARPLLAGPVGDSPGRDEVGELYQALDATGPEPGTAEFRRCRALLAVWFALSDDPDEAAHEAAFEAHWCGLEEPELQALATAAQQG